MNRALRGIVAACCAAATLCAAASVTRTRAADSGGAAIYLDGVEIADLKNVPCVLVASEERRENERSYYRDAVGFHGEFLFAETLQDARILVASGQGILPVEDTRDSAFFGSALKRIPLLRDGKQAYRTYCAFWKKDNPGRYMEPFAALLKAQFADGRNSH